MGGIQKLFLRITPIITLICFMCIGIMHIFSHETDTQPLTYLTYETYTVQEDNPETENIDESITIDNYEFDFRTYRKNINADKIKNALQNIINIQAYETTLANFNTIWEDGYQIGDISKTIANGVLLIVNTLFVAINIFIVPVRITAAILITILSLIGININRTEGIIIPFINFLVEKATIPLINPVGQDDTSYYENLNNTTWTFNNMIEIPQQTGVYINEGLKFVSNNQRFTAIHIINTKAKYTMGEVITPQQNNIYYITADNTQITAYTNGIWTNSNYRTIYLEQVTNTETNKTLNIWLNKLNATKQQTTPIDSNTYQWYETAIVRADSTKNGIYMFEINFKSNDENFIAALLAIEDGDFAILYYTDSENSILICRNQNWTSIYYRQFTLTNTQAPSSWNQQQFNTLLNNNFITVYEI